MNKIPQECRDIIGSFLRKRDHSNLALVSKSFYGYFSTANWRSVNLRGTPEKLYQMLGFFLDEKYTTKHSLIKSAWMIVDSYHLGPEAPVGLATRIADSLSRMTCVRFLSLHMIVKESGFDFAEFARGMAAAPRWDKLRYIVLDCDDDIAAAVLDRCELDVLDHITLTDWCFRDEDEDQIYEALKSRYSAQPHLLKSLQINFPYQESDNGTWDLIHEQVLGVHQVIEDFPALDHLRIGNEASKNNKPTSDDSSWQEFDGEIEELCKALNNSTLKEFSIEINRSLVDHEFVARGLQETLPNDYLDYFDNDYYLDDIDDDIAVAIDNWFLQLAKRIGIACPHFRAVAITYGDNDEAYFERIGDMTFEYIQRGNLEIWPGDGGLCE